VTRRRQKVWWIASSSN